METPVELKVRFGDAKLTGNQLLRLKVGDVILLDTDTDELLEVTLAGVTKFWGVSGTVKGNMALQIIKEEEPKYT